MMKSLESQAKDINSEIVQWRRELHAHPELDLNLPKTREIICRILSEMGLPYQLFERCSGITGIIYGEENRQQTVGLRADMDALPIQEAGAAAAAMHACGHDCHMAMLLGAAKLLLANRSFLHGRVKLIFQPGEECSGGAQLMIEEGALEDPRPDVIFGQHIYAVHSELKHGQIGVRQGVMMAARDNFTLTVIGKGCHGANPEEGVDPIIVAVQIVDILQTIVSREISASESAVLTIGAIHSGDVYNVIPDRAVIHGAIRCISPTVRTYLEKRIQGIAVGVANSMRARCEIIYEHGFDAVYNDPAVTALVLAEARRLFGEQGVVELKNPDMKSEDMSFFLKETGGCYWYFQAPPATGDAYPNHNPQFDVDESILYKGALMLAGVAIRWLDCRK